MFGSSYLSNMLVDASESISVAGDMSANMVSFTTGVDLFNNTEANDIEKSQKEALNRQEELEAHRLRIEEREKRKQETLKAEEDKKKGYEVKQKSFEEAMKRAKNEQLLKEKERANSLLVKTSILARMNDKQTEYQLMRKHRAEEMKFMSKEDNEMKTIVKYEAEMKRIREEAEERIRREIEMSVENELKCMNREDIFCRDVWSEIDRREAERIKIEKEEAARIKAEKWEILTEVAKPHGIHRDQHFMNLSYVGLGDIDTLSLVDESKIREVFAYTD